MASIKIYHTADVHLGMTYTQYPKNISTALKDVRFTTLKNCVEKANNSQCDLMIIAGDLFDKVNVKESIIKKAAEILATFSGPVAILPGNHDFLSSEKRHLWQIFSTYTDSKTILLTEKKPYSLLPHFDLPVALYPAPCHKRHSSQHQIEWMENTPNTQEDIFHIGVAHGAISNTISGKEGHYFPMNPNELFSHDKDFWLMGHIHTPTTIKDPLSNKFVSYPGTPEPDGFDCSHPGYAQILTANLVDKSVTIESETTGYYQFSERFQDFNSTQNLEHFWELLPQLDKNRCLLSLTLSGSLPQLTYESLFQHIETNIYSDVSYLKVSSDDLKISIDPQQLEKYYEKDSLPYNLLKNLLEASVSETEYPQPTNEETTQLAYSWMREFYAD
ncbi:DNA repair exonuclease [Bacteriovoracaceae bacterium]|nr:DNA repair exonuclease [Bacteriovoracaceae bacterium]